MNLNVTKVSQVCIGVSVSLLVMAILTLLFQNATFIYVVTAWATICTFFVLSFAVYTGVIAIKGYGKTISNLIGYKKSLQV